MFVLGTRIICNPSNQLHFQQIINFLKIQLPAQYKNETGFQKLTRLESFICDEHEKIIKDYGVLLKAWEILNSDQSKMLKAIEIIKDYAEDLEVEERELVEKDIEEEYKSAWQKFIRSTTANAINLSSFRQFLAMGVTNSTKQKGLTLATVHTVKGLGFDVVFIMGMNEGTFPDYRAKTDKLILEEKNTAYVAVTRAKRWLFITYPKSKLMPWGDVKKQYISRFIK